MKTSIKIFPFLLVAFCSISIKAQDILWEKSFGGVHADYLMDALPTPDYGFILAGSSLSAKTGNKAQDNNGDLDYWVWKMKENGDLDWQKSFGGSGNDFLHSIKLTNDGGFVLGGTSSSPDPSSSTSSGQAGGEKASDKKEACRGGDDIWIIKLDASGTEEWQKTIGGMGQEKLKTICTTKDGGYILGGSSSSPNPFPSTGSGQAGGEFDPEELKLYGEKKSEAFGNMDYWLVKLDRKGKIEWQKSFGGIYEEELRSIDTTNDGGYIVGGYSNSPVSGNKTDDNKGVGDFWVLKLDSKGDITWQKTIGGNQDDQLYAVNQTYDGNYVVGGNSNSDTSNEKSRSNASGTDIWILKLGQEGEVLWQETYNIGEVDVLSSIVENKDHTLLLGGFSPSPTLPKGKGVNKGLGDYVAIKITETGEELWRQSVGTDGDDLLKKVVETRDGGYLLAGISLPPESLSPTLPKGKGVATGHGKEFANIQQTQNKGLQNGINEVNNGISEVQNNINKEITDKMTSTTNTINDKLGSDKESSLKYGLTAPTGGMKLPNLGGGNGENALDGLANAMSNKQGKPSTGDQKKAFGSSDFWVVKLRDKDKKVVPRTSVEAMPNPATTFTNVIVGYEYQTGTATVADIAGHVLQQFEIKSQTIPIDLSAYPEGIYIINIKTNKGNDGVKVIKTLNRN
jgi:Secretion system C-terminal sorting domain